MVKAKGVLKNTNTDDEAASGGKKKYLPEEKKDLIKLVANFKDPIENKQTDATTTARKVKAWEEVTIAFNRKHGDRQRTSKQLKELFKTLKKSSRTNLHNDRIELYKTGGGTFDPKSTDIDLEVQEVLKDQFEPDENPFDDSAVLYPSQVPVAETENSLSVNDLPTRISTAPTADAIPDVPIEQGDSRVTVAPPRVHVQTPRASTSDADTEPLASASQKEPEPSPSDISGPSASWPGSKKNSSATAGQKRALSIVADTIVQRKKIKNIHDEAAHNEKLKILEDKAVLLDTGKEIKQIELDMKRIEKAHLVAVCKKKSEILDTELEIKKMELKIKELEYKVKLSECKEITDE